MWRKKIKQKKTQYTLIGVMIFVTIAIFALCFCFTAEFSMFSQTVLTEENSSDVYMMGIGTNELEENLTSNEVKDNIESYNTYEGSTLSVPILFNDKDITMMYQMMLSIDDIDKTPEFEACDVKGDKKAPEQGEIWVSKSMAVPCGIELGDMITLKYDEPVELEVTGIYTASFLITSNFCYAPVIVSDEDIDSFDSENQAAIFGINLKENDVDHITELRDAYPYCAFTASRTQLLENFMSVASSVGSFGAIAALIVFLVALVVIRYIVKTTILSEFKSIGVYKSLGYRSKKICGFYIKGYMVIGFIAALVGALLPLPLVEKLGVNCSQYAEGFKLTPVAYSMSVFSIGLFMLLLYFSLRKALKDVRKKSAVEIINIGQTLNERKRVPRSIIKSASSPFSMAINDIWKHKAVSLLILAVFILSIYLSFLFSMIAYSSYKMNDNANLWFAVPSNNTYVMGNISDDVIEWIEGNDKVDTFVYGNLMYSTKIESDDTKNSLSSVTFDIYNDAATDKTGVKIIGDAPTGKNEIVVTKQTLDLFGREVGDSIKLEINDKESKYKITGTYSSLLSNIGIMMTTEAMEACNDKYVPYTAFVTLKDINDFDLFKEQIEDEFTGVTVDKEWFAIDNSMTATRNMLLAVSGILIAAFIIFAVLNIMVVLLMESANRHRQYGILKALGFTTGYITKQNICKNMIYVIVSIIVALCLHLSVSKDFLAQKIIDAFGDSGVLLAGIIILFAGLVLLLTYIISLGVKKIMPIDLMEE